MVFRGLTRTGLCLLCAPLLSLSSPARVSTRRTFVADDDGDALRYDMDTTTEKWTSGAEEGGARILRGVLPGSTARDGLNRVVIDGLAKWSSLDLVSVECTPPV